MAEEQDLIEKAVRAARENDARSFFTHLAASHYTDALARRLQGQWPGMDPETIYDAVAVASDSLFEKVAAGDHVRSAPAYLWGAGRRHLLAFDRARRRFVPYDPDAEGHNPTDEPAGPDREAVRAEALRLARSLVPRLGGPNVQAVMSAILDCVEGGEPYVDNQTLAEITGLNPSSIRVLKHRGFQRMAREARKDGITLDEDYLRTDDGDEDDDE